MNFFILLVLIFNSISRILGNKYCSLESNGEPKYYICARNEYCCHFGCCVHLAFQFYQLWYYWLLLIFMFMICSGGSWWYKFCRQNETSNYPSTNPTYERCGRHLTVNDVRRSRALERNNFDNASAYYFQRLWKANSMTPPPNYYTASVVRYHSTSELETRRHQECPYYQLYGPPPSYESVIRLPENGYGQPSCTLIAPSTNSVNSNVTATNSHSNNSNSNNLLENSLATGNPSFSQSQQQPHPSRPSTSSMQASTNQDEDDDDDDDDDDNNVGIIPKMSVVVKLQTIQGGQPSTVCPSLQEGLNMELNKKIGSESMPSSSYSKVQQQHQSVIKAPRSLPSGSVGKSGHSLNYLNDHHSGNLGLTSMASTGVTAPSTYVQRDRNLDQIPSSSRLSETAHNIHPHRSTGGGGGGGRSEGGTQV